MARIDSGYLPQKNPCAQCGKPIAAPEWIEAGPRRMSYLWNCRACNYRFEAVEGSVARALTLLGGEPERLPRPDGGTAAVLYDTFRRPIASSAAEPAVEYARSIHAAAGH